MNNNLALICGMVVGVAVVVSFVGRVEAIPAFSRTYNTECKTCHTIVPERNEFGQAFEKNAFVWPGGKRQTPKQGLAGKAMDVNREALFVAGIPAQVPVSFLGEVEANYNKDNSPKLDFFSTMAIEVFTAGAFQDKVGWWGELAMERNGDEPAETALGELNVKFRNPFDVPVLIKVGRLKPTLSLWKGNNMPMAKKFAYSNSQVGRVPENIAADVSFSEDDRVNYEDAMADRIFVMNDEKNGLELSSLFGTAHLFGAVGVLNGRNNNDNDTYGHLSVRLFGTDFLGKEPTVSLTTDSITDFLTVTLGGYGYFGSWKSPENTVAGIYDNDYFRAGVEAEVMYKALRVRLGTSWGDDDNLYGDAITIDSRSYMGQAEYLVGSKVIVAGRYENLRQDFQGGGDQVENIWAPSVSCLIFQNVKLMAEYVHMDIEETGLDTTEQEIVVTMVFVF